MDSVVHTCENLTPEQIARLKQIEANLDILADLSRADILIYCPLAADRAVVVAQARPHSILPVHGEAIAGHRVTTDDEPHVMRALAEGRSTSAEVRRRMSSSRSTARGAPIFQEIHPIRASGEVVAAVCIETNMIERERHRRRNRVFQRALRQFQAMALDGKLQGADDLSPFDEHDGVMVVDVQHRIQYVSGIATSLYRQLGYVGNLLKRRIEDLELDDYSLVIEAMEQGRCVQREMKVGELVWIKKAVPLFSRTGGWRQLLARGDGTWRLEGALVTIHDETEARRQDEELQLKTTMIQEIHHRVKNNMQTIASLLRLQSRRARSDDVRRALQEGINRIMSVAVIHEFLAHQDARVINIRDVSQRIINQTQDGVLDKEMDIRLDLRGPNIYLPTQPATVCALVINELLQNSLEHGYAERLEGGAVTVSLGDDGEQVTITVDDDGVGLPEDFDLVGTSSLGLQIVRTLAEGDLKGKFEMHSRDKGVSAVVTFPKQTQGGR